MIFIDAPKPRYLKFKDKVLPTSHLISDTNLEELHAFVRGMGLDKRGFHNKPGKPHYDMIDWMIPKAIEMGAIQISSREIVTILKRVYTTP